MFAAISSAVAPSVLKQLIRLRMLQPLCFSWHALIRKKTFREYGQFVTIFLVKGHCSVRALKKKSVLNPGL